MKPLTDEYILTEESQTGQYGFEVFQNAENGQFYFMFVDKDGKPALFSQGYAKPASRDNGVESVLKNAQFIERFEIYKEGEGDGQCYYLTLKAANHQQIARSRYEKTLIGINKFRDMCMTIGHTAPVNDRDTVANDVEVPPSISTGKTEESSAPETPTSNIQSTRHKFNVLVYQDNKACKIEHVISGESSVIQGVSGPEIESFILRYMPSSWQKVASETVGKMTAPPAIETDVEAAPKKASMVTTEQAISAQPNFNKLTETTENEAVVAAFEKREIPDLEPVKEKTLVMDTPIVSNSKKEEPVFSFEKFLQIDGVAPTGEPTVEIDRKQVLKILRTPTIEVKREVKESPANLFIKTTVNQTIDASRKKGTGEDIVLEFATSNQSIEKFLNQQKALKEEEVAQTERTVFPVTSANERKVEDAVMEFIKKGKRPTNGSTDNGQVVLSNVGERPSETVQANKRSTCATGRPCPVSG